MPKSEAAALDKLRFLNELLGCLSDPERTGHARRALDFVQREHPEDLARVSMGDYVDKLAQLHLGPAESPGAIAFAHWHVPRLEVFSPLWIRQAIVSEMRKLAGSREALLLVTGLRQAVSAEGRYWTKQREAQYQRVRGWIDDLTCAWATRGSRLRVVVL
ncbi:MAG: hypothetical protein GVY36_04265 [Verrucomicrobia bacterium]|jgi:hypothetical protein|nr:hypothetical protein [Verrucomicrobiota bacterium]